MAMDLITNRLKYYDFTSKQEEENAVKEICQEISLAGLARKHFFKQALFQGGTCLRILHGLQRFSEDLDFILNDRNKAFEWAPYLQSITTEFEAFGLALEANDRSKATGNIKKAFLKEHSFGQVLELKYARSRSDIQKILIKLEIDINPPMGSISEIHYLEYPYPFSVVSQDIPSLFAGKCHALLCREYVKGRDWFDFIWYIQHKSKINYVFLKSALEQCGPYQGETINISRSWLIDQLAKKIKSMDWKVVTDDVKKFLPNAQMAYIDNWSSELFLAMLKKIDP